MVSLVVAASLAACAPRVAATGAVPPVAEVGPVAQPAQPAPPALVEAIAAAVAVSHQDERPAMSDDLDRANAPPKIERHLAHTICAGAPLPKERPRPRKATCCYPAREMLARPIRAIVPALRACYESRANKDAEGRVVFSFRIEQDGTAHRVCALESTTMDDEGAVRCLVEAMRQAHWPSMSDEERDLCGLITLTYPMVFER